MNALSTVIAGQITVIDGILTTTTQNIADVYAKRHDDVLRIVRQRMKEAGDWGVRNFTETPFTNPQNGQTYSIVRMTKKGFYFVVGKFTGAKAVAHQIAFADEFERMEQSLQQPALPAPSTISKEQIGIIYQTLCAKYPNGDNRHAAWSRFNKHFNLNEYKSLPAHRFDEALTWIGGVEVKAVTHSTEANEPALHKLPLQTMLTNERYLTYIDSDGTLTARPLASNDFVANMGNLAKRILNDLAFGSSDEDLMSIMDACKHTITQRIEAQERKLGNLKRLIA